MITHRMATQSAPEPPTKLYKVLAIVFLIITAVVLGGILFVTSKSASIVIEAKEDTKKINISVPLADTNSDTTVQGTATTTQYVWSEKFPVNGTKQVEGISGGTVTLYNKTASPQTLVKTTRLLSPSGILFRLTSGVTVPAQGQIAAEVYADKAGAASDIGPTNFTIPGLPAAKQIDIYAVSTAAMTGGSTTAGVLSEDDINKAKASYTQNVQTAFAQSLPPLENSHSRVISVTNLGAVVDHAAGDEVSSFTVSGTSTIVVVTYDNHALADVVDKQIASKVNSSAEKYLADGSTPEVSVGTAKDGTTLSVQESITVTLDSNVDMLAPKNFVGKRKEEIQRYILGLDHVAAVDVKFSPFWVLTAPSSADRIKVVVKNM